MISNMGYILYVDKMKISTINKLQTKLTIKEDNYIGKKKLGTTIVKLFKMEIMNGRRVIIIPHYVMPKSSYDNILLPYDTCDNITCNITLYDKQQIIHDYIYNNLTINEYPNSVCLKLKAGVGKSFIAASLIPRLHVKTIVIVPNEVVLNNWIDKVFTKELFPDISVGTLYGKAKTDGNIVVAVINSLIKNDIMGYNPVQYLSQFGFVIMDEVHKYTSEKRREIFWRTCNKYKLVMSASIFTGNIGNTNNMNIKTRIIRAYANDVVDMNYLYDDEIDTENFSGKVIRLNYYNDIEIARNVHGFVDFGEMVSRFSRDTERNKIILCYIKQLIPKGRNILIFVENIEHCNYLYEQTIMLFRNMKMHNNIINNTIKLKGGACKADITTAYNSSLIICTYSYGKEGMSYDQLDTMILGTPRRNGAEQFVARILRSGGDYSIKRLIIDIVDQCSNNFKTQFYDRKKFYDKLKFDIKRINYYNQK